MKKGLTEIVFILDRSGSMEGLENDTIGGFNAILKRQKEEAGEAVFSTVLFDDRIEVLHDRVPIREVGEMTKDTYYVRGGTALLDALGGAVKHIHGVHKHMSEEELPERTLFVITTDGMENASLRYNGEKVRKMIRHRKEKDGWEFLFLGANIDAVETAGALGIDRERAAQYECDGEGLGVCYEAINETVSSFRACRPIAANWKESIEEDRRRRGR